MRRIHKHRARCHVVNGFESLSDGTTILDEWEDLILVQTATGERAAIYLIDHTISLSDIQSTFEENQRQNLHTLYILAAGMFLPDHGDQHVLEDWMAWLATIYGGKIYGYMVRDHIVDICPIYFQGENGSISSNFAEGMTVSVRYGALIDAGRFRCWQSAHDGTWMVADYARHATPEPDLFHVETEPENRQQPTIFADDPYRVLGVSRTADQKMIRLAYIELARKYHPDANPKPDANRAMQAINAAYETLVHTQNDDGP